ncbi:MAG: hypothetical protein D9N11_10840 [Ketobacter sp.]|nr:MAG: hypothetical protein D9N11_10840 [Ketobacter sp.]
MTIKTRHTLLFIACMQPALLHAVMTDNLTIGNAKALSLGHAVTADPPGIDSIHFNPAGLTRLTGRQAELKLVTGVFDTILEFGDHYTDSWTRKLNAAQQGSPSDYTYDEARGQTSTSEGPAVMLPGQGMTELPVVASVLGGASYQPPGSDLTFATNVYSPLMVGFYRADDDPGRFVGRALSFTLLAYFSPSVAYKFTDTLSVGAAITFNYAGVGFDLEFREPNLGLQWLETLRQGSCNPSAPASLFDLSDLIPCIPESEAIKLYDSMAYMYFEVEDPLTFGVNFGVLWEAAPWLHFGAVYQSPIEMDMEGSFTWTQGDSFLNFLREYDKISPVPFSALGPLANLVEPVVEGEANLDLTMPDHFALGTSIQITPKLKMNADLKFTRWSLWDALTIEYSEVLSVLFVASLVQPDAAPAPLGQNLVLRMDLEDTWNYALGFEYQWNNNLALRFGFEDRPSSIPDDRLTPILPIGDAKLYSFGAEYKTSQKQTFSFAVASMQSSYSMPGNTTELGNSEDPMKLIYNPYSGNDITASVKVLLFEASYRFYF